MSKPRLIKMELKVIIGTIITAAITQSIMSKCISSHLGLKDRVLFILYFIVTFLIYS